MTENVYFIEKPAARLAVSTERGNFMLNIDLLNSALDLGSSAIQDNGRIDAEARVSAGELLDNIKWAKKVLAAAAQSLALEAIYDGEILSPTVIWGIDNVGDVELEEDPRKIIQDPQGTGPMRDDFGDNLPF